MAKTAKGQVFKETALDGRIAWRVRVTITDSATGKRRAPQKTCKTKREADATLVQWLADIERGEAVEPSKQTVGAYLQNWLSSSAQHRVRPSTLESYKMLVRVHVTPALGAVPLQKLTPAQLQEFYAAKLGEGGRADGKEGGLSQRTVRYVHAILKMALKEAAQFGLVARNVASLVKPPKAMRKPVSTWEIGEMHRFLETAADDGYGPIWLLALHTGMRRGELLGLRWQDVDLAHACLHVRQSLDMVGNVPQLQEPKTESGRRTVALDEPSVTALCAHRDRHDAWRQTGQQQDLVFVSATGGPINPHNLDRRFGQLATRAGVSRISFHGMRHTHATILMKAGVHPKVVSERLGHRDIVITLSTYSHVLPQMQQEAAQTFAEFMKRQEGPSASTPDSAT